MAQLPDDLLTRPAHLGARIVALGFLDDAVSAQPRLADPDDEEALHDFRVALRRLRSVVKAYAAHLSGSVPKKDRRALRSLAAATNRNRDAEVLVAWIRERISRLAPRERIGATWLAEQLEARRKEESQNATDRVRQDFPALERRFRKHLRAYQVTLGVDEGAHQPAFDAAAATATRDASEELSDRLGAVESEQDAAAAHRARIGAKRVRYVLEPFAGRVPGGAQLVQRLKGLQDLLGEFNEMHILATEIVAGVERAAAERAHRVHDLMVGGAPEQARRAAQRQRDERPGLHALASLAAARRRELFRTFDSEWLDGRAAPFLAQVASAADALERTPPPAAPEPAAPARSPRRRPSRRRASRPPKVRRPR